MSFNDQNSLNPTLNNSNNPNNNTNTTQNMFSATNTSKNINNECKTSQNGNNSSINNNNYLDFDFNDCDLFGGNNHSNLGNMMGGALHNHHQQQNNFFFDGTFGGCGTTSAPQGQGHIYFAPVKYGYLGQQEEQIFHDKQMNNIPDFEFGNYFSGNNHNNAYSLNPMGSINNTQNNNNQNGNNNSSNNQGSSNNNNNSFLPNNFLFSTYNTNNAVDLADLFPPEPVPKLENKQNSNGNYYMENADQFSPSHHNASNNNNNLSHNSSSQQPIITKTECSTNHCSSNTGLMNNCNNVLGNCNNFIGSTFNMNANNGNMFGDRSGIQMMPTQNPYGNHHNQPCAQTHYGMINDHSHLSNMHQTQHMMGNNQMPNYHHLASNNIHPTLPMIQQHNQQAQNISIIAGNKGNVFSIVRDQQKEKKKDYDKNICRYITRQVVRSFSSPDFKNKVLLIINEIYPDAPSQNKIQIYKDVTEFFLGEIENLSGFRALKDMLVVNPDMDGTILATQKKIFRDFMRWYLKERYFRNIINGNMKDKLAFIRYKNKIMLHYINKPHKWNSNKKKRLGKVSSPTNASQNANGNALFSSVNLSKQEY
ncbi:hypothetical protein TTHERM_00149540 (macronuclear) [Tetrahymena thermophila SB210]|uniref:Uncharacterized protein n=1 Tax=Tetrahymena thermophila (strain SB210) TaxID=312017 RepID=I7M2U9_TETTS|nr:hypothetical protein TTHERM_00149540 [Tetrahymena thermophila SB210]EAS01344.1 hypothetical protein TTHERM_00149540 [Tetrahymena thermophila SB210]|eukprot:XP_001021589.1 hypothetical protein TTHERM_00149540 [Tetrahymena thermophila SB210]